MKTIENFESIIAQLQARGFGLLPNPASDGLVLASDASTATGYVWAAAGGGGAPIDHGALTGLGDDDHSQYLLDSEFSTHTGNADAHHARQHVITAAADHTVTGSQWDLVGLTGTNTLGILTPTSDPGAAEAIVKTNSSGQINFEGGRIGPVAGEHFLITTKVLLVNGASNTHLDLTNDTLTLGLSSGYNYVVSSSGHVFKTSSTTIASLLSTGLSIGAGLAINFVNVGSITSTAGNLTIAPAGDIIFNPTGNDLLPTTNYDLNLGAINKKYLTLYAAELWVETLVAQDTIATIGGRILVGPTTTLVADLAAGTGDRLTNGDFTTLGAGDPDFFGTWVENAGSGTISVAGGAYVSSPYSCRLDYVTGTANVYQLVSGLTASTNCTLIFWARGDGTNAGQYRVYDHSNSAWITSLTSTGQTAASFARVQATFATPAACTAIRVYFYSPAVAGAAWFDDAELYMHEVINVKHNQMASGDIAYMEANGKVEFFQIASAATGTAGDYDYEALRNLDGTGSNDWYAGDAMFNTGATGDGFIDIYSLSGVVSGSGPTIVGNVRNSAVFNDWSPHFAIGNLNGLYGYGADTYGVGLGGYDAAAAHVTVDSTNGLRFFDGLTTVVAQWKVTGDLFIGTDISSAGTTYLSIFNAAQTYNTESMSAGDMLIGDNSTNKANILWDKSAGQLLFRSGKATPNVRIQTDGGIVFEADSYSAVGAASLRWLSALDSYYRASIAGYGDAAFEDWNYLNIRVAATGVGHVGGASDPQMILEWDSAAGTFLRLENVDAILVNDGGHVQVDGGVHVGNSATTALTDTITVDGGVNVGQVAAPGTGNIRYTSTLQSRKNSTNYTVYAYHPLTTRITGYGGTSRSAANDGLQTSTTLFSGLPANCQALALFAVTVCGTAGAYMNIGTTATEIDMQVNTQVASQTSSMFGIVSLNGSSQLYLAYSHTMTVYLYVVGYFI